MTGDIDELIAKSSVGAGLRDIAERGVDAHLADLEQEMPPKKKRRRAGISPTQRTMAELRKRGWTAQVVEHRVPRVNILRDLFGVIDVVALAPGVFNLEAPYILGIQATSGVNHAARRDKILTEPRARQWVEAGGRLELWSWSKRGDRGKRKLWALRVEAFIAESWKDVPPCP